MSNVQICVDPNVIRRNEAESKNDPPIIIWHEGKKILARRVMFDGPASVVYQPDDPLKDGTRVWVEAEYDKMLIQG